MARFLLALAVLLATVAPALVPIEQAFACSCAQPDAATLVDFADVVVVGTVDVIETPRNRPGGSWSSIDPVAFTVSAERYLKGSGGPTLTVNTARSGGSCGALEVLEVGERHVLMLQGGNGAYTTGLCDGNTVLTGSSPWGIDAQAYLSEIEALRGQGVPPDPEIGPGLRLEPDLGRSPLFFAIPALLGLTVVAGGTFAIRRRRSR